MSTPLKPARRAALVRLVETVVRGRATPRRPPSASLELLEVLDRLQEAAA